MATMNLYAELLSELGTIGNDESLLRKVLSAVKALKKEKKPTILNHPAAIQQRR